MLQSTIIQAKTPSGIDKTIYLTLNLTVPKITGVTEYLLLIVEYKFNKLFEFYNETPWLNSQYQWLL